MAVSEQTRVFFDVETQKLADEVGGWGHIAKMGLSCAVTFNSASEQFRQFTEHDTAELVAELQSADLVVGFNVRRFDYTVLQPYTHVELKRLPTLDMLSDIYGRLGFRVSLDSLAAATLDAGKSADGLQAVRWYKQGQLEKAIAYCQRDVELTRDLYEFGRLHGHVRFRDRRGRIQRVSVNWSGDQRPPQRPRTQVPEL